MNRRGISLGLAFLIGVAVFAAFGAIAWALAAAGQAPTGNQVASSAPLSSSSPVASPAPVGGPIVREIDDPHTGDRWLLVRNSDKPGAPGRLILASAPAGSPAVPGKDAPPPPLPVIHTGDRLIVEENTSLVQARLEAVALGPALIGSPLKVRLLLGGAVVRAVALGQGHAAFAVETRRRP